MAPQPPADPRALAAGLGDVKVTVTAILGRTELTFEEAVELGPESLVAMDSQRDDPVDLCVNGEVVARGRLVVVEDTYGVQITQVLDPRKRQ